jgi:dimethylaniline monooxygenase (N-oxide forming)
MKVAVIGGGPSGLATLKYLKTAHKYFPLADPIEASLFEGESDIGGTFRYRVYEEAEVRNPSTKHYHPLFTFLLIS